MYKLEIFLDLTVIVFDNVEVEQNEPASELVCALPPKSLETSQLAIQGQETSVPKVADSTEPVAKQADSEGPANMGADEAEPDVFDTDEEYVGVNDEHLYVPPPPPATQQQHEVVDDSARLSQSTKPIEPEVTDADPQEYHVLHDPKNPMIKKDALFPDIITFRKAIRHYAVTRGFEFTGSKTDKERFIARCAYDGCPWRIHASRLQDNKTIQVLPFDHDCPTTKLQEGKMATQGWVADRLGNWIKKNP